MAEIYTLKTMIQVFEAMKTYLIGKGSKLANFNEGSRLRTELEAIAVADADTQKDFLQALKNALPVAIYDGFGFGKKDGTYATGGLTFGRNVIDSVDYPIPVGTGINLNGIIFVTTASGTITAGNLTSGNIAAICNEVGVDGNVVINSIDTLSGQGSFTNQPNGVDYCLNAIAFTGGINEETEAERLKRFNTFVKGLASCTYYGIISNLAGISELKNFNLLESVPQAGWLTIYADDGTGNLSTALEQLILKVVNGDPNDFLNYPGCRAAGISCQVVAPQINYINVIGVIYILEKSTVDITQLKSDVSTAIQSYINGLRIGSDLIFSEMDAYAHNSNKEVYDIKFSFPVGNLVAEYFRLIKVNSIVLDVQRVTE